VSDQNVRETLVVTDHAYIINNGRIFRRGQSRRFGRDAKVKRVYLRKTLLRGCKGER